MEIKKLKITNLRNEEHYQFQTDFKSLVETKDPIALNIEADFNAYLPLYANEDEALDIIRKSILTEDISAADTLRDNTFRGLSDAVDSAMHHFMPEKRVSASRIQLLFDHYGNVGQKSYDEETAAISSLLEDLAGLAEDMTLLGLNEWATELSANNMAFDTLKKARYTQEAAKTQLRMKNVRLQVDGAYNTIIDRVDALVIVNGLENYESFIKELNQRIESYNLMLAQRHGRTVSVSEV